MRDEFHDQARERDAQQEASDGRENGIHRLHKRAMMMPRPTNAQPSSTLTTKSMRLRQPERGVSQMANVSAKS